jgi:hypothetical protein
LLGPHAATTITTHCISNGASYLESILEPFISFDF